MKKLIIAVFAVLTLVGCAGTMSGPTGQPAAITAAQDAATKSLYAIGTALQAAPQVMDALYNAGKMSKADYNAAVPIYNQVLASYKLAVNALQAAVTAGQDPNAATAYVAALQSFLTDKNNVDNLLTAMGQNPIGKGISQ